MTMSTPEDVEETDKRDGEVRMGIHRLLLGRVIKFTAARTWGNSQTVAGRGIRRQSDGSNKKKGTLGKTLGSFKGTHRKMGGKHPYHETLIGVKRMRGCEKRSQRSRTQECSKIGSVIKKGDRPAERNRGNGLWEGEIRRSRGISHPG